MLRHAVVQENAKGETLLHADVSQLTEPEDRDASGHQSSACQPVEVSNVLSTKHSTSTCHGQGKSEADPPLG